MINKSLRHRQAFTLIEILIIAALITLFSGLAIFSMQYLVDSSKRKSVFADARTIGSALSAAHMDLGLIPKIGYLNLSRSMLELRSGNPLLLPSDFDTIGFFKDGATPLAPQVLENWIGPFLPSSKGRSGVSSAGVGYTTTMQMPTNTAVVLDWPADPWGNPYVVYLLKITKTNGVAMPSWIFTPYEKADYIGVVVSYGPNRIPGGGSDPASVTPEIRQDVIDNHLMLYEPLPAGSAAQFRALTVAEHTAQRWAPLHNAAGWTREGFTSTIHYLSAYPDVPGIMDPGSDDIFYLIP